jgi:hypothetical protein
LASSIRDDRLIANPQKFLPLADVSLESHALGNPTVEIRQRSICLPLFPA